MLANQMHMSHATNIRWVYTEIICEEVQQHLTVAVDKRIVGEDKNKIELPEGRVRVVFHNVPDLLGYFTNKPTKPWVLESIYTNPADRKGLFRIILKRQGSRGE